MPSSIPLFWAVMAKEGWGVNFFLNMFASLDLAFVLWGGKVVHYCSRASAYVHFCHSNGYDMGTIDFTLRLDSTKLMSVMDYIHIVACSRSPFCLFFLTMDLPAVKAGREVGTHWLDTLTQAGDCTRVSGGWHSCYDDGRQTECKICKKRQTDRNISHFPMKYYR